MTAIRAKALSALRDGRVAVVLADRSTIGPDGYTPPQAITALVRSSRENRDYLVDLGAGVWTCSCPQPLGCAHIAAVQLATGHPSEAAKPAREVAA